MSKRQVNFTPFFSAEVDTDTGEVVGTWDWSDSCQGEYVEALRNHVNTPLAAVVCEVLDRHFGRTQPPVDLGTLPPRYVLTVDGRDWGAHVAGTREEIEAKIAEYRQMFKDKDFQIAEVKIPLPYPEG